MKKVAFILVFLMLAGAGPAFCTFSTTVDGVVDSKSKSDLRPVEDSAKLIGEVDKGLDMVTEPMDPVLHPVYVVRDHTIKGSKKVVNTVWDVLTLKSMRDKKEEK